MSDHFLKKWMYSMIVQLLNQNASQPVDDDFPEIAFTASSVAHFFISPMAFTFGSAAAIAMNYYMDPELRLGARSRVVTIPNTIFSLVGTITALVSLTPAGASGGIAFQAIWLGPYAAGSTAYRLYKSIK